MTNRVLIQRELNQAEIQAIQQLRIKMERQGLKYKIDLGLFARKNDKVRHLLCWDEGILIGYGILSCFDPSEIEVMIIMEPSREAATAIVNKIEAYTSVNAIKKTLFIVTKEDLFLRNFIEAQGGSILFSEYRLILAVEQFTPLRNKKNLQIGPILSEKPETILQMRQSVDPNDEMISLDPEDLSKTVVARIDHQLAACMRIEEEQQCYAIYGFLVREELRGQGVGRQFLAHIIEEILKKKPKEIYLEVSVDNQVAVHLYRSMGFQEMAHFDYYEANF